MQEYPDCIRELYTADGKLYGVMISPELWSELSSVVVKQLTKAGKMAAQKEKKEPMADWELLQEYWDFKYPPNAEVCCEICGSKTTDWVHDTPRKFKLLAANLGGLARFCCNNCQAVVVKRHFKDCIKTECIACELEDDKSE